MNKVTWNGLKNYPKIRKSLLEVSKQIKRIANSKSSHLADAFASIGANIYILNIHIKFLEEEFKKQKETHDQSIG